MQVGFNQAGSGDYYQKGVDNNYYAGMYNHGSGGDQTNNQVSYGQDPTIGELLSGAGKQQEPEKSQKQEKSNKKEKSKKNEKSQGLPPGLAKKEKLPPGLAKKEKLPPGLAKRLDTGA